MAIELCLRTRLKASIQAATRARACALVAKRYRPRSSNSSVECHDSITALLRADPTLPIDCLMPTRSQAARKILAGLSALSVYMICRVVDATRR